MTICILDFKEFFGDYDEIKIDALLGNFARASADVWMLVACSRWRRRLWRLQGQARRLWIAEPYH